MVGRWTGEARFSNDDSGNSVSFISSLQPLVPSGLGNTGQALLHGLDWLLLPAPAKLSLCTRILKMTISSFMEVTLGLLVSETFWKQIFWNF